MKPNAPSKPRHKTQDELARDYRVSQRTIRAWEQAGAPLGAPRKMAAWISKRRARTGDDTPEMAALKVRRLQLQCDELQREKDQAEGMLVSAQKYQEEVGQHIGDIRQAVRNLLREEQPATLAGRTQADIHDLNKKSFDRLCRQMQAAAQRLSVPGQPPIQITETTHPKLDTPEL